MTYTPKVLYSGVIPRIGSGAFVASNQGNFTGITGSVTPVLPGGLSAGNLVIVCVILTSVTGWTVPAGWTDLSSNPGRPVFGSTGLSALTFAKAYAPGDTNPVVNFTLASGSAAGTWSVWAGSGVDTTRLLRPWVTPSIAANASLVTLNRNSNAVLSTGVWFWGGGASSGSVSAPVGSANAFTSVDVAPVVRQSQATANGSSGIADQLVAVSSQGNAGQTYQISVPTMPSAPLVVWVPLTTVPTSLYTAPAGVTTVITEMVWLAQTTSTSPAAPLLWVNTRLYIAWAATSGTPAVLAHGGARYAMDIAAGESLYGLCAHKDTRLHVSGVEIAA